MPLDRVPCCIVPGAGSGARDGDLHVGGGGGIGPGGHQNFGAGSGVGGGVGGGDSAGGGDFRARAVGEAPRQFGDLGGVEFLQL